MPKALRAAGCLGRRWASGALSVSSHAYRGLLAVSTMTRPSTRSGRCSLGLAIAGPSTAALATGSGMLTGHALLLPARKAVLLRSRRSIAGIIVCEVAAAAGAVVAILKSVTKGSAEHSRRLMPGRGNYAIITGILHALGKFSGENTVTRSQASASGSRYAWDRLYCFVNPSPGPPGGEAVAAAFPVPAVDGWPRWPIDLRRMPSSPHRRDRRTPESRW
jgi:hypothetical protein